MVAGTPVDRPGPEATPVRGVAGDDERPLPYGRAPAAPWRLTTTGATHRRGSGGSGRKPAAPWRLTTIGATP